ncbi:hypothetical protein DSM112329_02721 [Paraconexibacter sp. AEG42_29]|uniref:IPT/TIG domain-containing protein n=2 Tax=Paraconexibacter sp. AEG42_29 TaxID=2997339 RepID=A0AAU7AW41_9ACTN
MTVCATLLALVLGATVEPSPAYAAARTPAASVLDVAPGGRGKACTPRRPCSLKTAQRAVRGRTATMRRSLTIRLADGTYHLRSPITLGRRDSGRRGHRVRWTAARGATPVLSGGRVLDRLTPGAGGVWSAGFPAGVPLPRQLYLGDRRLVRAGGKPPTIMNRTLAGYEDPAGGMRGWKHPELMELVFRGANGAWSEPRCGIAGIDGVRITLDQPCFANLAPATRPAGAGLSTGLIPPPSRVENALELLDAPGEFYVDTDERRVHVIPPIGAVPTRETLIAPVLETLVTGDGTPRAPVHDIDFRGITFAHSSWRKPDGPDGFVEVQANTTLNGPGAAQSQGYCATITPAGRCPFGGWDVTPAAVVFTAPQRVRFVGNRFVHLGAAGLWLRRGAAGNLVAGNELTDISGSAVQLGDTADPLPSAEDGAAGISRDNSIEDNWVHDVGTEFRGAVGIWVAYARGTRIANNQLDHLPYSAISVGWGGWRTNAQNPGAMPSVLSDTRIERNLVFAYMQVLQPDGGAIYLNGAQGTSRDGGTVVADNLVFDGVGLNAYYLDAGAAYVRLTGNAAYRNTQNAVGGCAPVGHFHLRGNFFAQPSKAWVCAPAPVDVDEAGTTAIADRPGPTGLPRALLAGAGLRGGTRALLTAHRPSVRLTSPAFLPRGAQLLVQGAGFDRATTASVDGVAARDVEVLSANALLVRIPPGASLGTRVVTITSAKGASPYADGATFRVNG